MSDWDQNLTVAAFCIPEDENLECIILVITDVYNMDIDNLDVKLVIQWDLILFFDSMIQKMSHARQKDGLLYFILFIPAWTVIKNQEEIEKWSNLSVFFNIANAQLSNSNKPKALI